MKNFLLYDSLLFTNKPDLESFSFKKIKTVAPQLNFWELGADIVKDFPSEIKTRELAANKSSSLIEDIYYIDIEQLPTGVNDLKLSWSESIVKLSAISNWLKNERNNFKFGFYDILPQREYWNRSQQWKDRNSYFLPLANFVDFVAPSLYTFYNDPVGWSAYAIDNINEAKKYNKPIYPFIWPQYHESSALKGQLINGDYWRSQLEIVLNYADGVIIWGGNTYDWATSTSTTDNNNWWFQTLDFINSNGL